MKKLLSILLSICLLFGSTTMVFADNEEVAFNLSLARLNGAYDYLNEVYFTTDLGMYVEYASQKDIDTLQRLADDITSGCSTDAEKCSAIWYWMDSNVKIAFGSYAPIDVFRTMNGVCSGHAQLMSALMKVSGVKASVFRGYLIDTNDTKLSTIYNGISEGHQWVMAYHDNDWYLYDDIWGECGNNDREDIASKYYTVNVDGISVYVEGMDMTKDEFKFTQTVYKDGEFLGIKNGATTNESGANFSMGGCLRYMKSYYTKTFDAYYTSLSGSVNSVVGNAIAGGYYSFLGSNIHYVKENGILIGSTVMTYDNNLILMNGDSGIIIDDDIDNNGMTNGKINMYIGETFDFSDLYDEDTILISLNKNFATTDGRTVTAIKSGEVDIRVCQGNSKGTLSLYIYGDARISRDIFKEYCDHECTHMGTDECEYCDYCGMFIETIEEEVVEEIENNEEEIIEEVVEDTVVEEVEETIIEDEEIIEEVIETPIEEETTTESAITTNDEIVEEVIEEENIIEEIVEEVATPTDTEEDVEVIEEVETVEEINTVENDIPTETVEDIIEETPIVETTTPIVNTVEETPTIPSYENTPTPDEEDEETIIINLSFRGNVDNLDISELLNDTEFINALIKFVESIRVENVYEYNIIVYIF